MLKKLLAIALLMSAMSAHADDIALGEAQYGGTGCPMGTASVALSPDAKALSILFDQYVAEAGGAKSFDRKNCNIAIPVHVPNGYSVSVLAIDYRGFVGLPAGGRAQLNVDYFLAGAGQGVRTTKRFTGAQDQDYLTSDSLGVEALVWSACGADTILRANTTMQVFSNYKKEQAMATVDSADVQAGLVYHFAFRKCR
jgi:hypothetical protein